MAVPPVNSLDKKPRKVGSCFDRSSLTLIPRMDRKDNQTGTIAEEINEPVQFLIHSGFWLETSAQK